MKVHIVADVEPIGGTGIENSFTVADALAQTLGGEVGTMLFEAEESGVEQGGRKAVYRLTRIGPYPGETIDFDPFHQLWYSVDELSGEVEGSLLPVKRWHP